MRVKYIIIYHTNQYQTLPKHYPVYIQKHTKIKAGIVWFGTVVYFRPPPPPPILATINNMLVYVDCLIHFSSIFKEIISHISYFLATML